MCVERQRYTDLNVIIFAIASILTLYPSEVGLYLAELVNRQFFKMSTYTSICFSKNMVLPLIALTPPPPSGGFGCCLFEGSGSVVDSLFIVAPLFVGDLCLRLVFISITLCHPSFVISLMGERKLVA